MVQTADIVVIGGGMAGISVAAHLAARARVTVVEMEDQPGYHSTGRSVATYIESYGNEVVRKLNRASASFLKNADPEFWHNPLLSARGLLMFALNGEEATLDDAVKDSAVEELPIADAVARVPILRPDRLSRAVYEEGVMDIDVNEMLTGFRRQLKSRGGTLVCSTPALTLQRDSSSWQVSTPGETYSAPVVVNASGAWVDDVADKAGLGTLGFQPKRRSVATVPLAEHPECGSWPVCGESNETFYFKPETSALLVSPADETPVEPHDAFADDMAIAEGLDRFCNATTVEIKRIDHTWGGLRTFSPDKAHVIGFDPRAEGFFWHAGQGGYGIQSAQGAALAAAALILDGELGESVSATGLARSEIAPDRFLT